MKKAIFIFFVPISLIVGASLVLAEDKEAPTPDTQAVDAPAAEAGEKVHAPSAAPSVPAAEGAKAFVEVAKVLQSPRCMNCHPAGDRPLQTDESLLHAMNISRKSEEAGLKCSACHGTTNSDEMGIVGGPPGAPSWHLPPKEFPMIFEGRTPAELCTQLKDPGQTAGKNLPALLKHVREDALVLWGWNPGGNRSTPPLDHATFVARFETWVDSGGACPD